MKEVALTFCTSLFVVACCVSFAHGQIKDLPWDPDRINRLPPEVRSAVLAMCATKPTAAHYFATHYQDRITLHFEHFHCPTGQRSFCNDSLCLHKTYKLTAGHYEPVNSFYGPRND